MPFLSEDDFRGRAALFISPHFDDVGFSCSGLLNLVRGVAGRILLCTVFGCPKGSPRPPTRSGLSFGDRLVREREDILFCEDLGIDRLYLDFDDAVDRLNEGNDICDLHFKGSWDEGMLKLREEISIKLKSINLSKFDYIFAPMGIGFHIDHVITHNSVKDIAESIHDNCRIIFYEELPYGLFNFIFGERMYNITSAKERLRELYYKINLSVRLVRFRIFRQSLRCCLPPSFRCFRQIKSLRVASMQLNEELRKLDMGMVDVTRVMGRRRQSMMRYESQIALLAGDVSGFIESMDFYAKRSNLHQGSGEKYIERYWTMK